MATGRKIDLAGLLNSGELTISTEVSEHATSLGVAKMFDGDITSTQGFRLENSGVDSGDTTGETPPETFTLNFNTPILGKRFAFTLRTNETTNGNITVNGVNQGTFTGLGGGGVQLALDVEFSVGHISFITVTLGGSSDPDFHDVIEIELFILEESDSVRYEFNDSVLSTKAWNSTRYDGKQLQASEVNFATNDDVGNNSKTPIVQNYSRNIYLGSRVISMGEETGINDVDDTSLVNYPGFSYVTCHEFITVHEDLSVSRHSIVGDKPNTGNPIRKGWYQSFYSDFPIGKSISLRFFDEKLETSLDSTYNIFFNAGQLKKILHVREIDTGSNATDPNFPAQYHTGSHLNRRLGGAPLVGSVTTDSNNLTDGSGHVFFIQDSTSHTSNPGASFTIFNKESIIDKFFNGSLVANPITAGGIENASGK